MARPRKNNAEYFSHDADMRNNPKIKAIRSKFGLEGYAVYCMTLEMLADADDFTISIDAVDLEVIAGDFELPSEKVIDVYNYFLRLKLIQSDAKTIKGEGETVWSDKLTERLEPLVADRKRKREWAEKRYRRKKAVKDVENPENEEKTELSTSKTLQSKVKESKVKESKVKESKVKESKDNHRLYKENKGDETPPFEKIDINQKKSISPPPDSGGPPSPKLQTVKGRNISKEMAEVFDEAMQQNGFEKMVKWTAKDMSNLKHIRNKLVTAIARKEGLGVVEMDKLLDGFKAFLNAASTVNDGWYKDNHFTPPGLNSQFQNILNHAKRNSQNGTKAKRLINADVATKVYDRIINQGYR